MLSEVVSLTSGERLAVELEIGHQLWVRNERGTVETVSREHLPVEGWEFVEKGGSSVDLPKSC